MAINAKEIFPNPEDRVIIKLVLDLFNGKIIRIKDADERRTNGKPKKSMG